MNPNTKNIFKIWALIAVLSMILLFPTSQALAFDVGAAIADGASNIVVKVIEAINGALNFVLQTFITPLMEAVLSFQNFFSTGVNAGWEIVRDFANLFFALMLLLIAIATVLNGVGPLSNYTAKRMLPSFIMAALLINFSKAIVGVFLDISQIIMIEFYNAIAGAGGIANAISSFTNISALANQGANGIAIALMTLIVYVVLIFVLLWTSLVLIVRIVTIWFLIMVSPLAFIAFAIPPLSGMWKQWSGELTEALTKGPLLMLYIYLAMKILEAASIPNASGQFDSFSFLLVVVLLFYANTAAAKGAAKAPGFAKSAIAWGAGIASFGLGAYVGAGGPSTGKIVDEGKRRVKQGGELVGGGINNVANVTGQRARLDVYREGMKESIRKGTFGKDIPLAGGAIAGAAQLMSDDGRKYLYDKAKLKTYENMRTQGNLTPQAAKALSAADAEAFDKVKDLEDPQMLVDTLAKDIASKNYSGARAAMNKIAQTGNIGAVFKDDRFRSYVENHETPVEAMDSFLVQELGDSGTDYDKTLRAKIAKSAIKEKESQFGVGLMDQQSTKPKPNATDPANQVAQQFKNSSAKKASMDFFKAQPLKKSSQDVDMNVLGKRVKDPTTDKWAINENGSPLYQFDAPTFNTFIENYSDAELKNPKSWENMNSSTKQTLITGLQSLPSLTLKEKLALEGLTS